MFVPDCCTPSRVRHYAVALMLILSFVGVTTLRAQGDRARVRGTVRAQSGRALAEVLVRAVGGDSTTTDAQGNFVLRVATGRALVLQLTRAGFVSDSLLLPSLVAGGEHRVALTLTPLAQLAVQQVVVPPSRPLLNASDATTGGSVEGMELRTLPTEGRDPVALAFTIPGVAQARGFFGDAPRLSIDGGNSLYTQYTIDGMDNNEGFLGGPRVEFPLAALARLEVLANSYSAEFGRSPSGVINYETRTGGDRWTGELFAYNRPGIPFDARSPIVPVGEDAADFRRAQDGFRRTQVGGGWGGPLRRGTTYGFGALEYGNENQDRISSTARATFLGRELRETWKGAGRIDHGWSPDQTTTLRFAMSHASRAGEGSGIVAPEADITTIRAGSITGVTHRSAWRGGRSSNVAALQLATYRWDFPPTRSSFDTPQVTILDRDSIPIGVVGSSNFIFDEQERQWQLRDVMEHQLGGRHTLRAGFDVAFSSFNLTGSSTNPSGAYEVVNEGNIPAVNGRYRLADIPADVFVRSYTIDAAQKQVDLTQGLYGVFVEDRWRPTAALTIRTGVRWDYDDLTSRGASTPDLDNVQPRLSVNWLALPGTIVRGGIGRFAGKLPYAVYSDAVQFGPDGNQTVTFRGAEAPAFGQGARAVELDRSALPPREIRELFALGIEQPMSLQATLGLQHQLGARASASVDLVWVDTRNLPRSWDLNAQTLRIMSGDSVGIPVAVGDASRPVAPVAGGYRRLTTTESGGRSTYAGLYSALRYEVTDRLVLDANWVWSHAISNTEDINFNATQGNDFAAERADANNDRRHKVTARATWHSLRSLAVSGIVDFQTGMPFNRVAYFRDLTGSGGTYGDGFIGNYQRFFGVPRNGERLPSSLQVSASVAYDLHLGRSLVTLRGEAFNVLNRLNYSGFPTGLGGGGSATQVGRPGDPITYTTAGPPRQVQFSVAWRY
jgi:hypothetical protein